ncbi:MAG: rhomboid family intramembrane serine protease [Verrucomicrobiota bacterium]
MTERTRSAARWSQAFELSSALVGCMILVTVVDWWLPLDLRVFGILPRTTRGLVGIIFSPVLHLGFPHLFANALPLLVLLVLLFAHRQYHPGRSLAWIWIGSGIGTWLIGRGGSVHIGASSIIYGLVVYLIAAGWWMRSWNAVIVALAVLIGYGGIFYGLLPQRGMVSWEGHLAGAIAGLIVARLNHA